MDAMRESWTDARLDDLNGKVDELGRRMDNGFNRVEADLRALREETKTEFTAARGEANARFERIDDRFDALQRLMLQLSGIFVAALIGLIATQL